MLREQNEMEIRRSTTRRHTGGPKGAALAALLVGSMGCGDPVGVVETPNLTVTTTQGVTIVALRAPQSAVMEALYQGTLDVSFDGCIRMESSLGGQTVVWPEGFTMEESGERWAILDATGAEVGILGGAFSFGGGIVTDVTDALGFTSEDQTMLQRECPGRYWIVGDVT